MRISDWSSDVCSSDLTIASSKLLDRSDIDRTGYQVSLNVASPVVALMPEGAGGDAWDEDQMSSYVDCGDYLLESHFQPPMSMASLMPGWFGDHAERMKHFGRVLDRKSTRLNSSH